MIGFRSCFLRFLPEEPLLLVFAFALGDVLLEELVTFAATCLALFTAFAILSLPFIVGEMVYRRAVCLRCWTSLYHVPTPAVRSGGGSTNTGTSPLD